MSSSSGLLALATRVGQEIKSVRTALASRAAALPPPPSGSYFLPVSPTAAGTSNTLGVGTLRVVPWVVERALPISRLGAEIATAGEAGSKFRIVLYADNGSSYPGALVLDAGQIAGDVAGPAELTVTATLTPGVYWIGGAVQTVTSTQPTMRTVSSWTPPIPIPLSTTLPNLGAGGSYGFSFGGVTGAAPAQFGASGGVAGSAPRVFARAA